MTQTALISVGIPTYNRPEGLRIALQQVTRQTYQNLEIIVSDNCSDDQQTVQNIVTEFSKQDARIKFFRQTENLGSLRNFQFLLNQAKGEFFLWAADDDVIDEEYIEDLYSRFLKDPGTSISMAAYDVNDTMSVPHIKTNLTLYLKEIEGGRAFDRMYNYLTQSDHFGKSRLMWGMFKAKEMREAFEFCLRNRKDQSVSPIWADIPAELRMLEKGRLSVGDKTLFHVNLLPSSDGKQGLGYGKKLRDFIDRSAYAYEKIILDADLLESQKSKLLKVVKFNRLKNQASVFFYYELQRRLPWFARVIKKMWYKFA